MVDVGRLFSSFVKAFFLTLIIAYVLLSISGYYLFQYAFGTSTLDVWMNFVFGDLAQGRAPTGMGFLLWASILGLTYYFYSNNSKKQ